jgi:Zn-dependent protease
VFNSLFIQKAFDPATQFFFFSVVISVVISITLHELAHGWAAIRQGDDTPIRTGHMTGNPLIHMGPFSIAALMIAGIAWGQMPIDPTRLRGKYAEAWVAFAGPAMNFALSLVSLTGLGLWWRFGTFTNSTVQQNGVSFLLAFGGINALLGVFNLFPVPPLDGSHIMANLNRKYAMFVGDPAHQGMMILAFIFLFSAASVIFQPVFQAAVDYVTLVAGDPYWTGYVNFFH